MSKLTKKLLNSVIENFDQYPDSAHIRPNDAIKLLGVSMSTFRRLHQSGKLKVHRLTANTISVKAGDLRAFMNREAANDE